MRIGISLAVLATVFASSADAAVVEQFTAADWEGLAFTSDDTGQFTHCSVFASYQNGSTLYISYEVGDSWFFSVANDSWSLPEGGNFAIKFRVDRRSQIEGTGVALGPTQIGLPVDANHPFVGQLRRGRELVISFQNKDYAFELSNSNKAMNAAQDCVRRHVRLGTHTPVVGGRPQEQVQESEQHPQPDTSQPDTNQQAVSKEPASGGQADNSSSADASSNSNQSSGATETGEEQQFGPWIVSATADSDGNFYNCTAYDVQGDDQIIMSDFPDGVWTFGFYRAAWKLDTNQTYYLWYNVDGPADAPDVVKRPVEAAETTRVYFEISDMEDIVERMENGRVLNVQFRGFSGPAENYSYPLDQVHAAFEATRQCVKDHASPPAEASTATDNGGSNGEQAAPEANTATGNGASKGEQAAPEANTAADAGTVAGHSGNASTGGQRRELPNLGPKLVETLDVPGWTAAAFSLDDGTFTHCAIKAEYQNGATLGVARAAGGDLVLAVQDGDWSLEEGAWVPLKYALTGDTPLSVSGEGQVTLANLIVANIGGGAALTEILKSAPEMTIEAEGKSLAFDISDIGPGIDAIDDCVARHAASGAEPAPAPATKKLEPAPKKVESEPAPEAAPGVSGAPDSAAAAPAPAETPPPADTSAATTVASAEAAPADANAIHTEAAGFTTALLFRAGYPNHVILGMKDAVPDGVPSGDAVWTLGTVVGSTRIVDSGTPDDIRRSIGGLELDRCGGAVATDVVASDATHEYFNLKCGSDQPKMIHYLVLPRDGGGSYVLVTIFCICLT